MWVSFESFRQSSSSCCQCQKICIQFGLDCNPPQKTIPENENCFCCFSFVVSLQLLFLLLLLLLCIAVAIVADRAGKQPSTPNPKQCNNNNNKSSNSSDSDSSSSSTMRALSVQCTPKKCCAEALSLSLPLSLLSLCLLRCDSG